MLFARQGKKFDYDLKQVSISSLCICIIERNLTLIFIAFLLSKFSFQLRFAGDLLMELGAGVELATAVMPNLFLPLACAANVAKVKLLTLHTGPCGACGRLGLTTCSSFSIHMCLFLVVMVVV